MALEKQNYFDHDPEMGNRNIFKARTARGLTMDQLAERTGISQSQLSRFESGKREPRVADLMKIAEALDVPPESLLPVKPHPGREEQPAKTPDPPLDGLLLAIFAEFGLQQEQAEFLLRSLQEAADRSGPEPLDHESVKALRELARSLVAVSASSRRR